MSDHDVVVVGSGPAGCAAALAARREGLDVLLVDATDFPRDKVCGDGIAPHALEEYAALGVDPDALTAGSVAITGLRLRSPDGTVAARETARPGWVIPRYVLDDRLHRAARASGVSWRRHRLRAMHVDANEVVIDDSFSARVVIGADGAESMVRRLAGIPSPPPGTVALALRGYGSDVTPTGEQLLAMTAEHWPAYAWAFPVGDGRSNLGYGQLLRGQAPTRDQLLRRLHAILPDVGGLDHVRGHRLPLSTGRPALPDGRILLVGDAAGLINPLTGEGIFYAALSGRLAGRAAVHGALAGLRYRGTLRARLGRHLRHTDLLARACRRPAFLDAAIRAAARSQHTFDRAVDLGLGDGRIDLPTGAAVVRALIGRRRT